jgi:hypothetical protein
MLNYMYDENIITTPGRLAKVTNFNMIIQISHVHILDYIVGVAENCKFAES